MILAHSPTQPSPVTLNLFQGPAGQKARAIGEGTQTIDLPPITSSGRTEKWTPDQVRGDEKKGRAE